MPLYQYICQNCKKYYEVIVKLDTTKEPECPHCKGKLKKLMSAPYFTIK